METIYGMKVHIAEEHPRMQCSLEFTRVMHSVGAHELVRETNAWMLSFFGTVSVVADGHVIQSNEILIMNQNTYHRVRIAMEESPCMKPTLPSTL